MHQGQMSYAHSIRRRRAMNLQFYRETVNRHGLAPALYHAAFQVANHVTEVVVWNALAITQEMLTSEFRTHLEQSPGQMVDAASMARYLDEPANMLTRDFLDAAVARGDRCYLI